MFFDLKKKISYKEWNVGFFNAIPEDLVSDNIDLSNITWLRRDSKFHCYADPFILNVSDCTIDIYATSIIIDSSILVAPINKLFGVNSPNTSKEYLNLPELIS